MIEVLNLGDLYVSDFVEEQDHKTKRFPLKLMFDQESGLVRLNETVPPNLMYGKYWYRSGTNDTMRRQLKNVVDSCLELYKTNNNPIWLDIACNDGTLFEYVPSKFYTLGIDPADNSYLKDSLKYADEVVQDYFSLEAYNKSKCVGKQCDIITCIAMFYDLENPDQFLQDIYSVLKDDGLFVLQMSYTPIMVEQLAFDNICFKPGTKILGCNKNIEDINIGDVVLDRNGCLTNVTQVFENDFSGDLIRLRATYVPDIECTPDHPILCLNKEKVDFNCGQRKQNIELEEIWKKAKDVNIGDYVCVPKIQKRQYENTIDLTKFLNTDSQYHRRGLYNIKLDKDLSWIIGLYVADGHIQGKDNNKQIVFSLNEHELDLIEKIKSYFDSIGYKTNVIKNKLTKCISVQISCTSLAKFLHQECGKNALNKKVPDFIFYNDDKEITSNFLNGFVSGDGFLLYGKDNANLQVNCRTSSKILKDQLQLLFFSHNVYVGQTYVSEKQSTIRNKEFTTKESWILRGQDNKIFDAKFERQNTHVIENDTGYWVKVTSTQNIPYIGKVYNLETQTNTYVVSNIITHNCHEHVMYYSLNSLKYILEKNNFKIVDCILNDVNGGSFRIYIQKDKADVSSYATAPIRDVANYRVKSLLNYEDEIGANTQKYYEDFFVKVKELKQQTVDFIKSEKEKGKSIWVYGASTKGNTLLQYFGLDHTLIDGAAERTPYKFGLKTIGTNIPIYSEAEMRKANPDYLLILPWHFISEFKEREKTYLENGGKFIVPCPKFTIVG